MHSWWYDIMVTLHVPQSFEGSVNIQAESSMEIERERCFTYTKSSD